MTTPVMLPADVFDPPLVPGAPIGLYQHVDWRQTGDPARFLMGEGKVIRPHNYGGEDAFGVWGEDWCADPDSIAEQKAGERPDADDLDPFVHQTVWAFDHNHCGDLRANTLAEVRARAAHNLQLLEQIAAERQLAARLITDAGTPGAVTDIVDAISALEAAISETGTTAFIHASPKWAAYAAQAQLNAFSMTPLGNTWVFGGGYVFIPWATP